VWREPRVRQDAPQVDEHLLVDVLLGRRLKDLGFRPDTDLQLAVVLSARSSKRIEQQKLLRDSILPLDEWLKIFSRVSR